MATLLVEKDSRSEHSVAKETLFFNLSGCPYALAPLRGDPIPARGCLPEAASRRSGFAGFIVLACTIVAILQCKPLGVTKYSKLDFVESHAACVTTKRCVVGQISSRPVIR